MIDMCNNYALLTEIMNMYFNCVSIDVTVLNISECYKIVTVVNLYSMLKLKHNLYTINYDIYKYS